jgi:NADH-quinone oxidoreductase subunit G
LTRESRAVIVCGSSAAVPDTIAAAAATGAKAAFILSDPNSFGAAALSCEHGGTSLAEALDSGRVKGVICFEAELAPALPPSVTLLAAADWTRTAASGSAEIFLPTTAWVEMAGTYINNEGRAQRFARTMNPGVPIKGLDAQLHPPRVHSCSPPGGELRSAGEIAAELLDRLGYSDQTDPYTGRWSDLARITPDGPGIFCQQERGVHG